MVFEALPVRAKRADLGSDSDVGNERASRGREGEGAVARGWEVVGPDATKNECRRNSLNTAC